MAGDLLTESAPTRLVCRSGAWCLEIERLVSVDRNVYQPRLQRVVGDEAIVQHLQRTANDAMLATAASTLIRGHRPDREWCFEVTEGQWVACEARARRDSARPSVTPAVSATVAELRAELCLVRAAYEGLRQRVAQLESRPPTPDWLSSRDLSAVALRTSEAPRGTVPRTSVTAPAPTAAEPPGRLASLRPAAPPTRSALKFPAADAVGSCLDTLIGKKVGVRQLKTAPFLPKKDGPCWFSRLVDDQDNEVGVIVADLLATVGLGGALMMIPAGELEAQRKAKTPSEDVLSAMAEVANNLSATINQQPDGLHVRVKPLEPMTPGGLDWLKTPAQKATLELANGLGHLFLFAR
jgi:hypothetical protein